MLVPTCQGMGVRFGRFQAPSRLRVRARLVAAPGLVGLMLASTSAVSIASPTIAVGDL
jgi:hypothetical protein